MERDNYPVLFYIAVCCILFFLTFASGGLNYSDVQVNFVDGTSCHAEKAHVFYENFFWRSDTQVTIEAETISLPNKENYIRFESKGEDSIIIPKEKILSIVSTKYCAKEDLTESQ